MERNFLFFPEPTYAENVIALHQAKALGASNTPEVKPVQNWQPIEQEPYGYGSDDGASFDSWVNEWKGKLSITPSL